MFLWINRLDQHFPIRYSVWALCLLGLVASAFAWAKMGMDAWLAWIERAVAGVGAQTDSAPQTSAPMASRAANVDSSSGRLLRRSPATPMPRSCHPPKPGTWAA